MNKYYQIDKSPYHLNNYFIKATEEVHKQFLSFTKPKHFSYQMIIINLFGLEPKDFFDYIQYKYKAKIIKPKTATGWKSIVFENIVDANNFANECERRFTYCIDNKIFERIMQ